MKAPAAVAIVLLLVACGQGGSPPAPAATGPKPDKLTDSFASISDVKAFAEEVLDRIAEGDSAAVYERLGNDAFRAAAPFEDVEKLVTMIGEKLGRPGPPALDLYKTNVLTEGIVAEASFDVPFANGQAKFHLRARKTDGRWRLEGFRVESPLLR